jgi:DNA-binding PadR family transcriptional regulator
MWWDRLAAGWAAMTYPAMTHTPMTHTAMTHTAMTHEDPADPGPRRPDHGEHRRGRGRHPHRSRRGPGFGFGPGLGFGPGFGPGSGPGTGFGWGRRGGRAARGDVRTAVLALLADQPRHGYEIIQEISARSAGRWRPSPGSVYPTIAQLEDEGLVRTEQTEGRRMVHLTEEGRRYCTEHADELAAVFTTVADASDDILLALRDITGQVATAAAQVAQAGTERQIQLANEALADTRRQLYRILAEDDEAPSS